MALKGFNPAADYPDQPRWFYLLGKCRGCTRSATGKLMGPRNESYGTYCEACADKRLARAKAERQAFAEYNAIQPASDPTP